MLAALVILLAAVAGGLFLLPNDDDGRPAGTAAPTAPAVPAPPEPPPAPPPPPGGPVEFRGARLTLPPGWRFVDDGAGRGCATRAPNTCDLLLVLPDVVESTGREIEDPRTEDDTGWYLGTDEPDCRSSSLVVRERAPVGDQQAQYREWEVDCTGSVPRVRMWWLPRTRVAAVDQSGDLAARAVIDEIVRTTDLSDLRPG